MYDPKLKSIIANLKKANQNENRNGKVIIPFSELIDESRKRREIDFYQLGFNQAWA